MDINDFRSFNFDGTSNEHNGVVFTIRQHGSRYILNFTIRELPIRKQLPLKVTMEPDNHNVPHIHISRGHFTHIVSIGLDGHFIHGENSLNREEKKIICNWIRAHTITLKELWDCAKAGRMDYQEYVEEVNSTWEYEGYKFEGEKPCHQGCIKDIIVWYDGKLSSKTTGGLTTVRSTGKMCVLSKIKKEDLQKRYQFESIKGGYQIKYGIEKDG